MIVLGGSSKNGRRLGQMVTNEIKLGRIRV